MTGISNEESIEPEHRANSGVIQHAEDMNLKCGRRCRELRVPPSWAEDGLDRYSVSKDSLMTIVSKLTKQSVIIPCPAAPPSPWT